MLFGCLLFVTNACQKDELKYDTPKEKSPVFYSKTAEDTSLDFFDPYFAASQNSNINPSTASDYQMIPNPLLQEIIQELSTENDANNFVTKTTKMIGYPIWNKSSLYENFANAPNVSIVMTPFAFLNEDKTNSILMTLKVGNDFHFNVISREYADFITNPETISQFNLDVDFIADMEIKKGMYCSYDGKVFDAIETLDNPFTDVQIDNLELEDLGGTPQYTMTIIIWIVDPYGSCDMFGGGGGGTLTGHAINIHTSPTVGGPGGSTGNPTGSGSGGSGGGFNPNEDGDGFDEDFEDEAEFDPNFNDALNGFEDRVINKVLAALGVFNLELTGDEQEMILAFIEYLDSTNPAFIPDPVEAFHDFLLATDSEYAEFSTEFASFPPWAWEIIKELLIEAIIEFAKKNTGINVSEGVIDAMKTLNNRDLYGFCQAALELALQGSPQGRGLKAIFMGGKLMDKARFIWSQFKEMSKIVGDEVLSKIFKTINKNFDLMSNLNWSGNKGIKLVGKNITELWEDMKEEFGLEIKPDGNNNGGFYMEVAPCVYIGYYPVSITDGNPAIEIRVDPNPPCNYSQSEDIYKFRAG